MPVGAVMQTRPVMQGGQPRPQGPLPVGAGFPGQQQQQRPMMIQGGPGGPQRPPMGMMGGPQGVQPQWQQQVQNPQTVTLQQRGPMGGPPPQVMGMRGPGPPQRMPMEQHPAFMNKEPTPPPAPPPLNQKSMTPPPENPQTDEDKAKVARYEEWLNQHQNEINNHLAYYETEISKLRKQRKVRTFMASVSPFIEILAFMGFFCFIVFV